MGLSGSDSLDGPSMDGFRVSPQQQRPSAAQADGVPGRAALLGRDRAGNAGSPMGARPSQVPVRARGAAEYPGQIGTAAEAGQPAVRARPSQVRARAGGVPVQRCGIGSSCQCPPRDQLAGVQRDLQRATAGGGAALPAATRAAMERAFSADFSVVRVHTGPESDRVASGLGASALTAGQDIVFRAGAFWPHTPGGDRLLAHELAHVVQQAGGLPHAALDGGTADPLEKAAESAADQAVISGRVAGLGPAPSVRGRDLRAAGAGRRSGHGRGGTALAGRTTGEKAGQAQSSGLAESPAAVQQATAGATDIVQRAPPTASHAAAPAAPPPAAAAPGDLSDPAEIDRFTTAAISLFNNHKDKPVSDLAEKLHDQVNSVLQSSSVPVPFKLDTGGAEEGPSVMAIFRPERWSLTLYWGAILQTEKTQQDWRTPMSVLSLDYVKRVATAIYHETRHCEQEFMAARVAAHETPGKTKSELAKELGIPDDVAERALNAPPLPDAQKEQAQTFRAFAGGGKHNDYDQLAEHFSTTTSEVRKDFDDEKLTDDIGKSDSVSKTLNIYSARIHPGVSKLRGTRHQIAPMTAQKDIAAANSRTALDATVSRTLKGILSKLDAVLDADETLDINLTKASLLQAFLSDEDAEKAERQAIKQSWDDWAVLQEAIRELDRAADAAYRALPGEADSYRLEDAVRDQLRRKGRTG
jgi:hypothetical protein